MGRFVSIWFRHLHTDWFSIRNPELKSFPFVLRTASHGRMIITEANAVAEEKGIHRGMVLADARALVPELKVEDDLPDLNQKLLTKIAEWCIRFTPISAVDAPDGILLDASGCTHLWGGEEKYLNDISKKLSARGYDVRIAMADTPGLAWGMARFGQKNISTTGDHRETLLQLPAEALRLDPENLDKLHKLGLKKVGQFASIARSSLRRRFGVGFLQQLDKAFGHEWEILQPVIIPEPYQERLPALEPIITPTGIELGLEQLLNSLCFRLQQEQKGLRSAVFKCFRVDGKVEQVQISTTRPTHHVSHLLKLFEIKLPTISPGLGIELFILEAPQVEDHGPSQQKMWETSSGLEDVRLAELIDRLSSKVGGDTVHRYLPDEHYWPERSFKPASTLVEEPTTSWQISKQRPLHLLQDPEPIEVTAPIPDYPPMLFRHKGKVHKVVKADGPERIEQEWWMQSGLHRDYYIVEDEEGARYWLFRSGHYNEERHQWFLHGRFA